MTDNLNKSDIILDNRRILYYTIIEISFEWNISCHYEHNIEITKKVPLKPVLKTSVFVSNKYNLMLCS